jgi:hypothetical protein
MENIYRLGEKMYSIGKIFILYGQYLSSRENTYLMEKLYPREKIFFLKRKLFIQERQ